MTTLHELLRLLSCDEFEQAAEAARRVEAAPEDPDMAWTEDAGQAMTLARCDELADFMAESDKLDELHMQLRAMFEDGLEPFPDALYRKACRSQYSYLRWLDERLAERGYALILVDPGLDENMRTLVVCRADLDRITELADELPLPIGLHDGTEPAYLQV